MSGKKETKSVKQTDELPEELRGFVVWSDSKSFADNPPEQVSGYKAAKKIIERTA